MINYTLHKLDDKAPCFLLLHGWGVNSTYMESIANSITKDYSYLLIDLPGHGKSYLDKAYKIDDYCDAIFQIIITEKIKNLYGIGHSFGGKILLRYSQRFYINGLLLIAPSAYKPTFSIKIKYKIIMYKILKKLKLSIPKMFSGSDDYQNSSGLKRETFNNICHYYFGKNELEKIKVTTYIMAFKDDDQVKINTLKKLKKYMPNSKLLIYEGNHFSYFYYIKEIQLICYLLIRDKYASSLSN